MQEKWGNLIDIGFPRLLHNIFQARDVISVLDMEDKNVKKRFFFKTGIPVYGISNILNESLGRLMVQHRIITQDIYEKSLEVMLNEKKKQGEVLLSGGHITSHQLNDALNLQTKERLFSAFKWINSTYHYYSIEKLPKDIFLYPVHPAYAILYAFRNGYYPADRMKKEVDDKKDAIAVFSNKTNYSLEDFQPNHLEKNVLTLINGKRKLGEVISEIEAKNSKEDIYPFICALISTDIILLKQAEQDNVIEDQSPEDKTLIRELTSKYLQMKSLNYFDIIGVSKNTDTNSIKKAYYKLAKQYHPDTYNNNKDDVKIAASNIFSLINTVYTTLIDEKSRKTYEESLLNSGKQDIAQDAANIMNAEIQFQKGKVALSRRDYESAKTSFELTVKLNPTEGEYKAHLGWTIFNLSPKNEIEVQKAKELIEEGIKDNPKQDKAYYFIGVIYKVEGKIDEAEAALIKAVKQNPNITEAQSELRFIQKKKQKDDKGFFKNIFN